MNLDKRAHNQKNTFPKRCLLALLFFLHFNATSVSLYVYSRDQTLACVPSITSS